MLSPPVYYSILFLVCAFAFWRGRSDERIAAATCVAATFATNLVYSPRGSFSGVEVGVFLVDAATFAAFTFLALRSERFWPLWLAGLQLTTVFSHMLKAVQLDLMPQAYAAAARFWVYPIFLIIVVGTWRSYRRRTAEPRLPAAA
ncbi:MAG: hypothetical protein HOP96_02840 [Sphingomonas sp.]|nr:hypothetical protein [Sphingomonas sp.]